MNEAPTRIMAARSKPSIVRLAYGPEFAGKAVPNGVGWIDPTKNGLTHHNGRDPDLIVRFRGAAELIANLTKVVPNRTWATRRAGTRAATQ